MTRCHGTSSVVVARIRPTRRGAPGSMSPSARTNPLEIARMRARIRLVRVSGPAPSLPADTSIRLISRLDGNGPSRPVILLRGRVHLGARAQLRHLGRIREPVVVLENVVG